MLNPQLQKPSFIDYETHRVIFFIFIIYVLRLQKSRENRTCSVVLFIEYPHDLISDWLNSSKTYISDRANRTSSIPSVDIYMSYDFPSICYESGRFHPPFLWRSKHQTKLEMTVHINNLVPSEFPNRTNRSVR